MNREFFFNAMRPMFPNKRFDAGQVAGLDDILDVLERRDDLRLEYKAYMLATAFHETAFTMQPVRETRAASDAAAIAILDRAFARGQLTWVKTPYWRPDAERKSWLGRGLVQLTHKANYAKMAPIVGADLVGNPGLAMDMDVAIAIMIEGMLRGSFTGKKLGDYLGSGNQNWAGARRIINPDNLGPKIGNYGRAFLAALKGAVA